MQVTYRLSTTTPERRTLRINLSGPSILVLSVVAEIETDDDILEGLGKGVSPSILHGSIIDSGGYSRNRIWQQVLLTATRHEAHWRLGLVFTCPAVDGSPLGPPSARVKAGIGRMEKILQSEEFSLLKFGEITGSVEYRLDAGEVATVIPIPFLRNDDPAATFTEVQGIKLAKEGPISEAFVADFDVIGAQNRINLNIRFNLEGRFDINAPDNALQRAQHIKSRLISQRRVHDG